MTSVTVENFTPCELYQNSFPNRENATLYVPIGCKTAYEAADYWKDFMEIIEKEPDEVKLSQTEASVSVGNSVTLKATVYPTTLEDKSVTWKTSNKKVATVSGDFVERFTFRHIHR